MRTVFCVAIGLAVSCGGASTNGSSASADGAIQLSAAIDAANRTHHPLVVEFGAAWCKPCHVFADHVLTDARVQAALRDITFVQYDIDTSIGADAAHRCNVAGVPAIVGVDPGGKVTSSKTGSAPTVDEFLAFLHAAGG